MTLDRKELLTLTIETFEQRICLTVYKFFVLRVQALSDSVGPLLLLLRLLAPAGGGHQLPLLDLPEQLLLLLLQPSPDQEYLRHRGTLSLGVTQIFSATWSDIFPGVDVTLAGRGAAGYWGWRALLSPEPRHCSAQQVTVCTTAEAVHRPDTGGCIQHGGIFPPLPSSSFHSFHSSFFADFGDKRMNTNSFSVLS